MIIFVNGAFGIGKTAVARALKQQLPRSVIFDPELIGIPLLRVARFLRRPVDDFQDLRVWRTLTAAGLRVARRLFPTVIVPMSLSEPRYLNEIRQAVARVDKHTFHFCLVAPVTVVNAMLRDRGAIPSLHQWEFRRAAECCAAHLSVEFAHHIDAVDRSPRDLAAQIARAVSQKAS